MDKTCGQKGLVLSMLQPQLSFYFSTDGNSRLAAKASQAVNLSIMLHSWTESVTVVKQPNTLLVFLEGSQSKQNLTKATLTKARGGGIKAPRLQLVGHAWNWIKQSPWPLGLQPTSCHWPSCNISCFSVISRHIHWYISIINNINCAWSLS